jgi:hypothetical protein
VVEGKRVIRERGHGPKGLAAIRDRAWAQRNAR